MNGWGYQHMGGGAWALMIFMMIVFWVVVVIGIVAFMRRSGSSTLPLGPTGPTTASGTPEQILRARFARGEIDDSEFRIRMAALKDDT